MKVVFTFGRFNPPTIGHEKLIKKVADVASGGDFFIYASYTQNSAKDPLPHKDKVKWMKKVFPKYKSRIVGDSKAKDAIQVLVELYGKNYTDVVMVVGSDRVLDFQNLLNKYNGKQAKHGFYEFNTIKVVSAGERDPDATGVEGMSASKMRKAVVDGDMDAFKLGIPIGVKDSIKADLYNAVKKYMKEYYEEGTPEYRRYLQRLVPGEVECEFPSERALTQAEKRVKEKMVKSLKKNRKYFKKKYGKDWKGVMYGTATNQAKNEGAEMKTFKNFTQNLEEEISDDESVEERYDGRSYKGRVSTVSGGVAMTDDTLDRMRIMMRNISKFEGVDVLADEISNALSNSEIRELKSLL